MSAYMFLTPRKPIRGRDNIYYQYFTKLWGGGEQMLRRENDTS